MYMYIRGDDFYCFLQFETLILSIYVLLYFLKVCDVDGDGSR